MLPRIEIGQFITFTYSPPVKPPKRGQSPMVVGADSPAKEVFVIHPNWHGKVHAIDLKRVTPAEVQVLHAIMDPNVKAAVDAGQWPVDGVPNYPLIRDILRRLDPIDLIKTPLPFYQRLVKPFIRDKDAYRQYFPQFISGVQVIRESHVSGPPVNVAPLFKKI